jgi:hypothetical protein
VHTGNLYYQSMLDSWRDMDGTLAVGTLSFVHANLFSALKKKFIGFVTSFWILGLWQRLRTFRSIYKSQGKQLKGSDQWQWEAAECPLGELVVKKSPSCNGKWCSYAVYRHLHKDKLLNSLPTLYMQVVFAYILSNNFYESLSFCRIQNG